MRIEHDLKLGFKDVLFRPKRSTLNSRQSVDLKRKFQFKHSPLTWEGIPIIAANMDTVGSFDMAQALSQHSALTAIHKHYTTEQWSDFMSTSDATASSHLMISTGTSTDDYQKISTILQTSPEIPFICIDIANGYSEHLINFVSHVRESFPDKIICAGNVVTGDMVEALILAGADIIKVGIGPGSVCTTRVKTGVGYPQLSAIIECADAAHGLGGHIIGDGGCSSAGDVAKAFGGGADFVMLGGMFAGHDESTHDIVEKNGEKFAAFYGMSSQAAMQKHSGGVADYRSAEGKEVLIPYRGAVEQTLLDILGGLRSTCTYVGAQKLKELTKRTTFIRVNEQENTIFNP